MLPSSVMTQPCILNDRYQHYLAMVPVRHANYPSTRVPMEYSLDVPLYRD